MKRLIFLLICFGALWVNGQRTIAGYEYWFNHLSASRVVVPVSPSTHATFADQISTAGLGPGIHTFNFRTYDNQGVRSSTSSSFFYKMPETTPGTRELNAWEYWFNNDYSQVTREIIIPSSNVDIDKVLSVIGLQQGIHILNFRFRDNQGLWSGTTSSFFYKLPKSLATNREIITMEYWFNGKYSDAVRQNIAASASVNIDQLLQTNQLTSGIHTLNIRFRDSSGLWSGTSTSFFYKSLQTPSTTPKLTAWQYWIGDRFDQAVITEGNFTAGIVLNELISMKDAGPGLHTFNIRFRDNSGLWSAVTSHLFFKAPLSDPGNERMIYAFRYWFNNDTKNITYIELNQPVKHLVLDDMISMRFLPKGVHTVHFQFRETSNLWSAVASANAEKLQYANASFNYEVISEDCTSTMIQFINNSVDANEFAWNFGDGNTSNELEPVHTFSGPGNFDISLRVADSQSQQQSETGTGLVVIGETFGFLDVFACNEYVSAGGNTWYQTGKYTDRLAGQNQFGCDSVVTVDLTINTLDISTTLEGITITSNATGASYQWIRCDGEGKPIDGAINRSFTPTTIGNYAVVVTGNGCTLVSDCVAITTVDVPGFAQARIALYPNPARNQVTLVAETILSGSHYQLINNQGAVVATGVINGDHTIIDLSELPAGLYFVRLAQNGFTARLIRY